MIYDFQQDMVKAWTAFSRGECDAAAVKSVSSYFGIYPQRNDKAMMRIRRTSGVITPADLRSAARILAKHGGAFAHLSTRQCIQLHSMPPAAIPEALSECEEAGFHFRGGGGDTFRNVLVSDLSGLWPDSVFDVRPYAHALTWKFFTFDTAFHLPRKLKVSFADRPADAYIVQDQDLGFLAKIVDGKKCFETWIAGGIGIRPRLGLKLFDALPADECIRVAMALATMFNEHGCRTNRAKARIRHLRTEMGDEAFVAMFKEYYAKMPDAKPTLETFVAREVGRTSFPVTAEGTGGAEAAAPYTVWKKLAVSELKDGLRAVRVFVPFGNFTAEQMTHFADVMEKYGVAEFSEPVTQDLLFAVPENQLAGVYQVLTTELAEQDYTCRSFVGHIRTCIGCTICKSGVTDSPAMGRAVAEYFDRYLPIDTDEKLAIAKILLDEVRISGCPNSCTCQVLSRFGFSGRKMAGEDGESVYTPGSTNPVSLGALDVKAGGITKADFPKYLEDRILSVVRK